MTKPPITVTQPYLPPLQEFIPYLEKIWESHWLTNSGPFHKQFEAALAVHLGVEYLSLFANGTLALVTALQELRIAGEVITTPFSFVATSHSLLWNGIRPVFVDIDPVTFNIDPDRVEAAISPATTAILATHVFGQPCDVVKLQNIADHYGLKLIFDAAHAFDVTDAGGSILRYGDFSILSFHATKVFNTFEGGAIICPDARSKKHIDFLKNFGFADEVTVVAPGINGKMNEVQAAFGLLQLEHIGRAISRRGEIDALYRTRLAETEGITLVRVQEGVSRNFAYFPILVGEDGGEVRDSLYEYLRAQNIQCRRYFYPLISEFPMYRGLPSAAKENLPIATAISRRVLCLPIYPDLSNEDVLEIAGHILDWSKRHQ